MGDMKILGACPPPPSILMPIVGEGSSVRKGVVRPS